MSELASKLAQAWTTSPNDLVIFDRASSSWIPHPWPEVQTRAENIAERILDGPDGHVGLVGEPTVEFVATMQGAWLAGRALSILPSPVRGAEPPQWAAATLNRFAGIGVTTVFGNGEVLGPLRDAESTLAVHDVGVVGHAQRSRTLTPVAAPVGAPAVLQGTAGSTGTPKTAVLSTEAVLANMSGLNQHVDWANHQDVVCSWLPQYHDMGLVLTLTTAIKGRPLWLAPTAAFAAAPFQWLKWLSDSKATVTAAPNFAYNLLGKYARRVPEVDLSNLRFAINGGEPVDCEGFAQFFAEMARFGLDPGAAAPSYGMAESTCATTLPALGGGLRTEEYRDPSTDAVRKYAVLGHPVAGMELRITPSEQHSGGPGPEVGEVEVRGTSMMSGYLGGDALGPDEWFQTGDLGYLTDDGLVVCGRAKEVIMVAGRNVFPTEVENVAAQVPGVRAGSVAAIGAGEGSARPGLVIAAEYRGKDGDGIRSQIIARVAAECGVVPSDVVLLAPGSLPRTSSGKLRRLEVKRNLEVAQA